MEERPELPSEVIRRGFSNLLKELTLLNESSPRIFMMYTHSLYEKKGEEERATFNIAKQIQGYLCPTIQAPYLSRKGHLKLNLYSNLAPQGNGSDPHNEYKEADVLYRQMCLLPKHTYSVDYVILCGSHSLQEYSEITEVGEYINHLRIMLSGELSKAEPNFKNLYGKAKGALDTLKERCRVGNQKFHHIYTELAFLQLRLEEKLKDILPPNNLITVIIDRDRDASSSSIPPALHSNSIYIGTAAWAEEAPKAFYLAIFQLLRRLFGNPGLGNCRSAIDNAHSTFIDNTNPTLWTGEDAKEFRKQHSTHQAEKIARQRAQAKNSFFALSTSNEEDTVTEEEPITEQPSCKTSVPLEPNQDFIRKKLLPYEKFNFLDIEKAQRCYIDKTCFIEVLLRNNDNKFIRWPNGFGKSLFLSVLGYFLDADQNKELKTSLNNPKPFKKYCIGKNKDLTASHQGKYTVIFLNFLELAEDSYKGFIEAVQYMLTCLYEKFSHVQNEDTNFKKFSNKECDKTVVLSGALRELCDCIFKYNKSIYPNEKDHYHKPFILIDEFDAPLLKASAKSFLPGVLSFMQQFLLLTFKSTEQAYSMAVLSGTTRLKGMNLLSTLNNISTYSIIMEESTLSHYLGFTEEDVKTMLHLRDLNVDIEYPNLLEHYGYYFCGNQLLFNPWSIAHAIRENKIDYQNHWNKYQQNKFIRTVIEGLSEQLKNILKQLLREPHFISNVVTNDVSYTSPTQELTILNWEQKESQTTGYALLRDKNGNWRYRYATENTFYTEKVDANNNISLFSLVKNEQEADIGELNEEREFKEDVLRILVQEKNIIRLDEKVWLLSLLYSAGFLTGIPFTKENKKLDEFELALMIPNKEIFDFYIQEMGLKTLDYPYEKRSEVIKRISSSYFTKDKLKELLDNFVAIDMDANFTLFYMCSLLSNIAIPRKFLESFMNSSDVANFISLLEKYSFIDKWDLTKNSIDINQSIHTLVFYYFQDREQKYKELNEKMMQLIQALEQFFTERDIEAYDATFIEQQTMYYRHVERIVTQYSKDLLRTNRVALLYRLACYELYIGMHFELAVQYFTLYINSSNKEDISNNLLIAKMYHGLGLAYYRLGQFSDAEMALNTAIKQGNSPIDIPSEEKKSCTQDAPYIKASEDFKKTVTSLIAPRQRSKRFSFILSKAQEKCGFHIELANKNKLALQDKDIRSNLVALKNILEENLKQIGLLDGAHYDIEFDGDASTLLIISSKRETLNTIGAILEDAGQSYWNAEQLSHNFKIFFFNSSRETNTESFSALVTDEITCGVQ